MQESDRNKLDLAQGDLDWAQISLEDKHLLVEKGRQARAIMEVPLFQELTRQYLRRLAGQLAALAPMQRNEFTEIKAMHNAAMEMVGLFELTALQGDKAQDAIDGKVEPSLIL